MVVLGFEGGREEVEDIAFLLAAGFDDGQQGFDEAAASGGLGAEGEFAPDHGVAQDLFGAIIRGLDSGVSEEYSELLPAIKQVSAQGLGPSVRGPHPVFESLPQVVIYSESNAACHRAARGRSGAIGVPVNEHLPQVRQQSLANHRPLSAAIDQGLEVAFSVGSADLSIIRRVITAIAIGTHHAAIVGAQHALDGGRRTGQTDPEHGVQLGRSRPQQALCRPSLVGVSSQLAARGLGSADFICA